jgi:hypothetical protein
MIKMPFSISKLFSRSPATTSTEPSELAPMNRSANRQTRGTTSTANAMPTALQGLQNAPAHLRTQDNRRHVPSDVDMSRTIQREAGTETAFGAVPGGTAAPAKRTPNVLKKKPPVLPEKKTLSENAFMKGFGVTSKTVALTPFYSVTDSAQPNLQSSVRKEGDAPLRESPALKNGGQPKAASEVKPSKTRVKLEQERLLADTDTALDELFVEHTKLFRSQAAPLAAGSAVSDSPRSAMLDRLKTVKAEKGLSTAQVDKLAKTLDLAFRDSATPVKDGIDALNALQELNLLGKLRANSHLTPPASVAESNAWMLAQRLEAVPGGIGMALINKLTPATPRPAGVNPTVTAADRVMLRSFLAASAAVANQAKASGATVSHDPYSLFNQPGSSLKRAIDAVGANNWPGSNGAATPLGIPLNDNEKAMLAVTDELKALDQHVLDHPKSPFRKGTHGCVHSIGVVHNRLTESISGTKGEKAAKKAKGGPVQSEFEWIDAFAEKAFDKHLDRALKTSQPEKLKGIARLKRALNNHLNVNSNKSAFHAYDSVTSSKGLNRGLVLPHRSPIAEGRAFGKMLTAFSSETERQLKEGFTDDLMEPSLTRADGKLAPEGLISNELALRSLVRAQIIATTRDQEKMMPDLRYLDPRSELTKKTIFNAVRARIGDLPDGANMETLENRIKDFINVDNQPLTAQRILQWASEIGGPANEGEATRMAKSPLGPPAWHDFAKGFDRVENGFVEDIKTPPLEGMSRHEAALLIRSLGERDELGSGYTITNGGNVQVSTKGVSGVVSNALLGVSGNIRINLAGGQVRLVSFEKFTSTDRSGVRIATSTLTKVEAGAGASVGHAFDEHAPVTLSFGGDASYKYQVTDQVGAVFGFARHATGGVAGDEDLSLKKTGELIQILLDDLPQQDPSNPNPEVPGNAEDFKSRTRLALQAFPYELSVGSYEFSQTDHALAASLTGGAGVRLGEFRLGLPNGHVGAEGHRTKTTYRDNSGWLRTEKKTESLSCKATADIALASLGGLDPLHDGTVSGKLQLVAGSGATGNVDFYHHMIKDATNIILAEEEELPTSFQLRSYGNGTSYLKAKSENIHKTSHEKGAKYHANEYLNPELQADVVARIENSQQKISNQFLERKDLTATPNDYFEYDQKKVVDDSNNWRADKYFAEPGSAKARSKEIDTVITELHADPANHQHRFVVINDEVSTTENKGANNIMGVTVGVQNQAVQRRLGFA